MRTIFEKIIDREIPARIEFEDDDLIVFHDIHPQAPTHLLIVPKKKIPTLNQAVTDDALLLGKLLLVAKDIAKQFEIEDSGYRLVINCNDNAGQTVFHLHVHLLGGNQLGLRFG